MDAEEEEKRFPWQSVAVEIVILGRHPRILFLFLQLRTILNGFYTYPVYSVRAWFFIFLSLSLDFTGFATPDLILD